MNGDQAMLSYPAQLDRLAQMYPEQTAIVSVAVDRQETSWTWRQLAAASRARAAALAADGVGPETLVAVALPNSLDWYSAVYGAWHLGCTVLPLDAGLPAQGRAGILATAAQHWDRAVVVDSIQRPATNEQAPAEQTPSLPADVDPPSPGLAVLSGGSTGKPKIIVNDGLHAGSPTDDISDGLLGAVGFRARQVQLVAGPLFHGAPAVWSTRGLFHGHTLVVMTRFDASLAVDLIERHRVSWAFLVPTMMRRIAQLPTAAPERFRSIDGIVHASAPCPPSVKRAWLDLLGPERVFEGFGGSEAAGSTVIRGDEWLSHPGSVGKPTEGWEVAVLADDGTPVPTGAVGLIHMRPQADPDKARFRYVGAVVERRTGGWVSIGDLGWMDADGYVFVADRRSDLIITGGANVYPAEVEAVLLDHPSVSDVAVVGVPDADLGHRVHAVVEPRDLSEPPAPEQLLEYCRSRLSRYKVPRSVEFVEALPRNDQGKLRRAALVAERPDDQV